MFSKRHYQAIALAMQSVYPAADCDDRKPDPVALDQWQNCLGALAAAFERDNGLFKRDLFLRACQPGTNVRKRT